MLDPRTNTVADVLRRSADRMPERVALRFADSAGNEREWTYAELDAAVSRAAHLLVAAGTTKGERVAAYGKNSDAYLIGFLACARAGLVHVPINFNLTGTELTYLLEQSGSTVALVDPTLAGNMAEVRADTGVERVIPLRDADSSLLEQCSEGPATDPEISVADDDLTQLLYTSGTTSQPKGAMMTHRALLHEYLSCVVGLDFTADDHPLHAMPLYHSAQMHVFLVPYLMVGATNRLVETPEPGEVLRRIESERITAFFAAPTVWVGLANHDDFARRDLTSLRKAYYGASIMPGPVLQRLRESLPQLGFYNCFGQSEIAPLAAILRPEEHETRPDSAGRPALFVEAKVVDEQGEEVAPGELGEIVYRSPQLCTGYWDKPSDTAEAFRNGWFHSGDLVRRDEDGYFFVVDRIKDVINTGGVLVASREVEDVLYTHPAVAEVAVIALPDPQWIESIAAVVVARSEVDESALLEHVRSRLAGYKVPKRIRFVDDLPRNSAGKLLKRVLREEFSDTEVASG
ncbi:fatty-acyl-CoA synthase [Halopolyspora algeriensis]|uniref:Fatty-acyl-CoA synthase n=1 Tax=Halopolyspora algeriensis TaxID=1500506 RepID=A0A368VUN7_9ACTN|nr:acyl-CoA synthetase [Halopolyspora algeriensis]RCW45794.1 fatty-acyl-CoA synthase [Halopolyspora algeriensis]TQM54178.1 fatty-acyl-CoA synthase [Halopolyspora algeriensis]